MAEGKTETVREGLFGQLALRKGWLREEEVATLLEEQRRRRERHDTVRIGQLAIEQGFLTTEQVRIVIEEQRRAGGRELIEGYRILAKVGEGAVGSVYQARRKDTGEIVALKILAARLARDEDFLRRFYREARAACSLRHPNIVRGMEVGQSRGFHYYSMEFIEGKTVKDIIAAQEIMPESQALNIVIRIAEAVKHAGRLGIIHRDIKPENIMITSPGEVKLADLGLAKTISEEDSLTRTGVTLGTPKYMSPEQIKTPGQIDIRSDIYSLGATFYHMVTGRSAFGGDTLADILSNVLFGDFLPPHRTNAEVSQDLSYVISKMMSRDRQLRYQTPDELLLDLERLRGGQGLSLAFRDEAKDFVGSATSRLKDTFTAAEERILRPPGVARRWWLALAATAAVLFLVLFPPGNDPDPNGLSPRPDPGGERPVPSPEKPAYHELLAWLSSNAGKDDEALRRITCYQDAYPFSPHLQELEEKRKEILNRQIRQPDPWLAVQARFEECLAKKRFREATRLLDQAPPEARARVTEEFLRQAHERVAVLVRESWDGVLEKTGNALGQQQFEQARKCLAETETWEWKELDPEVAAKRLEIDEREKVFLAEQKTEDQKRNREKFLALLRSEEAGTRLFEALASRDYQAARQWLDQKQGLSGPGRYKSSLLFFRRGVEEVDKAEKLWFRGLEDSPAAVREFRKGGVGYRKALDHVEKRTLYLAVSPWGSQIAIAFPELDTDFLIKEWEQSQGLVPPAAVFWLALFEGYTDGQEKRAGQYRQRLIGDEADYFDWLEVVFRERQERRGAAGEYSGGALAGLEPLLRTKKWKAALEYFVKLKKTLASYGVAGEAWKPRLEEARTEYLRGLFPPGVMRLNAGSQVQLYYRFFQKGVKEAFSFDGKYRVEEGAGLKMLNDPLTLLTSRTRFEPEGTVTLELSCSPDNKSDKGVSMSWGGVSFMVWPLAGRALLPKQGGLTLDRISQGGEGEVALGGGMQELGLTMEIHGRKVVVSANGCVLGSPLPASSKATSVAFSCLMNGYVKAMRVTGRVPDDLLANLSELLGE